MLDRVTGMQVFARVAGLGSLSAAARALGMSQTMATKHMAALEGRLGTKLLHRTTRRLTLTEAGRRYLDASRAHPRRPRGGRRECLRRRRRGARHLAAQRAGIVRYPPDRPAIARTIAPPSRVDGRSRPQRSICRSHRGRLGPRHPHWRIAGFKPRRAAPRPMPHDRVCRAVLSCRPRHAHHDCRPRPPRLPGLYVVAVRRRRPLVVRRATAVRRSRSRAR